MQAELQKVIDGRYVLSGFIAGDLHLMIPDRGGQITLRLIVIRPYIYHTLYRVETPPLY